MKTPLETYQTITNFNLSNLNLKVRMESSEPLDTFQKHIEVFQRLKTTVESFKDMNVNQIKDLLVALQSFENILSVEITNPHNHNGFIFDLSSP
jgi:hypothetical protein